MMKSKWMVPAMIFVGALLLILSSTLNHTSLNPQENVYIKIGGLIFLMTGLYNASKRTQKPQEGHDDEDRG